MEPPRLLPGRPAYDWVRYTVITLPVCIVGLPDESEGKEYEQWHQESARLPSP